MKIRLPFGDFPLTGSQIAGLAQQAVTPPSDEYTVGFISNRLGDFIYMGQCSMFPDLHVQITQTADASPPSKLFFDLGALYDEIWFSSCRWDITAFSVGSDPDRQDKAVEVFAENFLQKLRELFPFHPEFDENVGVRL